MNERGRYGRRGISRIGQTSSTTLKTLDEEWNETYQILASQVGELIRDRSAPSGYSYMTQAEWNAHPPDPNKVAWWKARAQPLIQEWVRIKRNWDSVGDSDVLNNWKKRLDMLRIEAWGHGFLFHGV